MITQRTFATERAWGLETSETDFSRPHNVRELAVAGENPYKITPLGFVAV